MKFFERTTVFGPFQLREDEIRMPVRTRDAYTFLVRMLVRLAVKTLVRIVEDLFFFTTLNSASTREGSHVRNLIFFFFIFSKVSRLLEIEKLRITTHIHVEHGRSEASGIVGRRDRI